MTTLKQYLKANGAETTHVVLAKLDKHGITHSEQLVLLEKNKRKWLSVWENCSWLAQQAAKVLRKKLRSRSFDPTKLPSSMPLETPTKPAVSAPKKRPCGQRIDGGNMYTKVRRLFHPIDKQWDPFAAYGRAGHVLSCVACSQRG